MQAQSHKDVVKNITSAAQLEEELQLSQAQHGVAVLDIYNAEWGHCKTLSETFRRLFTDAGDLVHLRFFSVECNAVLESLHSPEESKSQGGPKSMDVSPETLASYWTTVLTQRQNHSRPYFAFYKEGRMRTHLEGIDTPRVCRIVRDLCKQQNPAADYITNADLLSFWQANFSPSESEIDDGEYVTAIRNLLGAAAAADVTRDEMAYVTSAVRDPTSETVSASALQSFVGEEGVLRDMVLSRITQHREAGATAVAAQAAEEVAEAERAASTPPPGGEAGEGSPTELSFPSPAQRTVSNGSRTPPPLGSLGSPDLVRLGTAQDESTINQIFTNRWVTVEESEMHVWNTVAALPLHYPTSSTIMADVNNEVAAATAAAAIPASAEDFPTLAAFLESQGVTAQAVNMMCIAADQKVGSESLSYGKLSLILMSSEAEVGMGLVPACEHFLAELSAGTLLTQHPPLAFTALALSASEAYPDESFYYCFPDSAATEAFQALSENDQFTLYALAPLSTAVPAEGVFALRITGLPKVIELATTDACEDTTVLSQWYAKLQVGEREGDVLSVHFVENVCDDAFQAFLSGYVARLIEDENQLDKKQGGPGAEEEEEAAPAEDGEGEGGSPAPEGGEADPEEGDAVAEEEADMESVPAEEAAPEEQAVPEEAVAEPGDSPVPETDEEALTGEADAPAAEDGETAAAAEGEQDAVDTFGVEL